MDDLAHGTLALTGTPGSLRWRALRPDRRRRARHYSNRTPSTNVNRTAHSVENRLTLEMQRGLAEMGASEPRGLH